MKAETATVGIAMLIGIACRGAAHDAARQDRPRQPPPEAVKIIGEGVTALEHDCPPRRSGKAAALCGNPGAFFGQDDYPPEAMRAGQEGRVVARLEIDSTGKVVSCTVTTSSGSTPLDQKTCQIALEKVSFTPAVDRKGRAIAASYPLSVRWVLPTGPQEVGNLPLEVRMEQTVSVDSSGEVVACNTVMTPPNPVTADPCLQYPVGKKLPHPWLLHGKPVGGVMKREMRQQVVLDP